MVEMSHQDISNDEFRSRGVSGEGRSAMLLTERCSARYGLRGEVGEASHPGPQVSRCTRARRQNLVSSDNEPMMSPVRDSSDDETLLAVDPPPIQPVSGTLPTWVDSDRFLVDVAGRNVHPRLRKGLVSPTILDGLEDDLETSAAPTVPASALAAQCLPSVRDRARDHESMELDAAIPAVQMAAIQQDSAGEGVARPGAIPEVARTFVQSSAHFAHQGVQSSVTVAPMHLAAPGRVAGVAEVVDMASPRGQARQDWESVTSCLKTESVGMPVLRRLTLLSRAVEEEVPDSHEQRVARVRRAMQNEHKDECITEIGTRG